MTARNRMKRLRERHLNGEVLLRIVTDEIRLFETLVQFRLLDPMTDPDRRTYELAVERLLETLSSETVDE